MESIKYYKLVSPYEEDETMNCKLTMSDLDQNFLTFKNYDIKDASYDKDNMSIIIERNNGDILNISISSITEVIEDKIEEALSEYTPGCCDYEIEGNLDDNGILTLSLISESGESTTQISGFTKAVIYTDETIQGEGSKTDPLRLSNLEKTGKYKSVLDIVNSLPNYEIGQNAGDRFITNENFYIFGRLYNKNGFELVKEALNKNGYLWRIPTIEDWFKLFRYAEVCLSGSAEYDVENIELGEYVGDMAASALKSVKYWEGNDNFDSLQFSAVPSGYIIDGNLTDDFNATKFWTETLINNENYVVGFDAYHDNVFVDNDKDGEYYSIRLVIDIEENSIGDKVNILGNTYDVISIKEINQAWITVNLNYKPNNNDSEQFDYHADNIKQERFKINHWNGDTWETKELNNGDEISVKDNNAIYNFVCVVDENGNQQLIKGEKYMLINNKWRMVIDCGTY